jgi:hypothetical protein
MFFDEYYPVTSMAGNIAYIANTVPGMIYPHNISDLPKMGKPELNEFYDEYATRVSTPTFLKRVLFIGSIPWVLQYAIPFILHHKSGYNDIYEPFRLEPGKSLRSFYRTFGRYPQNDILIEGKLQFGRDQQLHDECEQEAALERRSAQQFVSDYRELASGIEQEASQSNLTFQQVSGVRQAIIRSVQQVERWAT